MENKGNVIISWLQAATSNDDLLANLRPINKVRAAIISESKSTSAQGHSLAGRALRDITNAMGQNIHARQDVTLNLESDIVLEVQPFEAQTKWAEGDAKSSIIEAQ